MPNKLTYGKRKKSILSLFPILNDDDKSPSVQSKAEKRVSATISMSAFYGKQSGDHNRQGASAANESTEGMAGILTDDVVMSRSTGESGKRLSKLGSSKVLSQPSGKTFIHEKALPRLPRLSFDGRNAYNTAPRHAISVAVGTPGEMNLLGEPDEIDSCPPPVSRQPSHSRKSSAPLLPRKSSKRTSGQPDLNVLFNGPHFTDDDIRQPESRTLSKRPHLSLNSSISLSGEAMHAASSRASPDVSQQIESMLAASRALKLQGNSSTLNSPLFSKNSGRRVLSKMKNVITEQLQDKKSEKHHNLANDEHLLDSDLNQLPDYEEEASTVSALELRINEGINFRNPKIQSLTGHGTIRRKPIPDDGRSLISRKSVDVLSLEGAPLAGAKKFTSFESRRQSTASFDQSADIISSLPSKPHSTRDEPRRQSSVRRRESGLEVDFDALFSSSPIAQSTPRIRLEPTFEEDGGKVLRNVPALSRSLFDPYSFTHEPSDTSINATSPEGVASRKLIVKRNNSQVKDIGLGLKSHLSKRRKKHPSPSKAELEGLETALAHYSPPVPTEVNTQDELTRSFRELQTGEALKSKDSNAPLSQAAKRSKKGNTLGLFSRSKPAMTASSMAEPARRPMLKPVKPTMIPKPAGTPTMKRGAESRRHQALIRADQSAMETDELQWESTAYHIGMRG